MASLSPRTLRVRIAALHDLRERLVTSSKSANKENLKKLELGITLVRNGVFPENVNANAIQDRISREQNFPNSPLSLTELMTFNTYFQLHPEKVCGKEILTGSRDFPVSVSGDRIDVEKAINQALESQGDLSIDDIEAMALEAELNLFEL